MDERRRQQQRFITMARAICKLLRETARALESLLDRSVGKPIHIEVLGRAAMAFNVCTEVFHKPPKEAPMFEVTMTVDDRVKISCTPVDKRDRPAKVDGDIIFETSTPDAVVERIDPLSCYISAPEIAGDVTVTISADADLGEGIVTVTDAGVLHVGDPAAVSLGVNAVVEPKPE